MIYVRSTYPGTKYFKNWAGGASLRALASSPLLLPHKLILLKNMPGCHCERDSSLLTMVVLIAPLPAAPTLRRLLIPKKLTFKGSWHFSFSSHSLVCIFKAVCSCQGGDAGQGMQLAGVGMSLETSLTRWGSGKCRRGKEVVDRFDCLVKTSRFLSALVPINFQLGKRKTQSQELHYDARKVAFPTFVRYE